MKVRHFGERETESQVTGRFLGSEEQGQIVFDIDGVGTGNGEIQLSCRIAAQCTKEESIGVQCHKG